MWYMFQALCIDWLLEINTRWAKLSIVWLWQSFYCVFSADWRISFQTQYKPIQAKRSSNRPIPAVWLSSNIRHCLFQTFCCYSNTNTSLQKVAVLSSGMNCLSVICSRHTENKPVSPTSSTLQWRQASTFTTWRTVLGFMWWYFILYGACEVLRSVTDFHRAIAQCFQGFVYYFILHSYELFREAM